MPTLSFVFFDAGGGHRSSATALCEVIQKQGYPWQTRMVNLQEVLDPIDVMRRLTGHRIQDLYNGILQKGWTLGAKHILKILQAAVWVYHREEVRLLENLWRQDPPDLVVSVIPHFNRALKDSLTRALPGTPFVTILTDIANYPPRFWMESQEQFIICGSDKAVEQARKTGIPEAMIYQSSGMIISPRFYEPVAVDRSEERRRLGLYPALATGLVMFGGQGSEAMLEIAERMDPSSVAAQWIFICGRNQKLAEELRRRRHRNPCFIEGFTKEIPYYMHLSDFFIGKPGPGSISEALAMKLPVIVEENAWTLPQERYNVQWIREKQVGVAVNHFRDIVGAVTAVLEPENFSRLKANAAALNNRAVLEIPGMLSEILEKATSSQKHAAAQRN